MVKNFYNKNIETISILYFYKFFKNPLNLIFVFGFTLFWTIISYFIWGRGNFSGTFSIFGFQFNDIKFSNFAVIVPGLFLFSATTITIMSIPSSIGSDRIHKRTKVFRSYGVNKYHYLFSIAIVNLFSYFLVLLIQVLLSALAFKVNLGVKVYVSMFFLDLLIFISMLFLSLWISQFGKTDRNITILSLLIFYPILFLSGNTIPAYVYDPDGTWFKYIQFLSPIGAGVYWGQAIFFTDVSNFTIDFSTDFLGILIPILELIVFVYFSFKFFKWN